MRDVGFILHSIRQRARQHWAEGVAEKLRRRAFLRASLARASRLGNVGPRGSYRWRNAAGICRCGIVQECASLRGHHWSSTWISRRIRCAGRQPFRHGAIPTPARRLRERRNRHRSINGPRDRVGLAIALERPFASFDQSPSDTGRSRVARDHAACVAQVGQRSTMARRPLPPPSARPP